MFYGALKKFSAFVFAWAFLIGAMTDGAWATDYYTLSGSAVFVI